VALLLPADPRAATEAARLLAQVPRADGRTLHLQARLLCDCAASGSGEGAAAEAERRALLDEAFTGVTRAVEQGLDPAAIARDPQLRALRRHEGFRALAARATAASRPASAPEDR
jgi:hypothetical protein